MHVCNPRLLQTPRQNIDDASVVGGPSAGREIETVELTEGNTSVQLTSTLIDLNPDFPGFGLPTGLDGDFARTIGSDAKKWHRSNPVETRY